ncbi:ANTAR domain-containing protein [Streptomyces sp. NPDC016845]|uniref:ANTAR domain-containing protein n=1 Tax=Streptomyces sp. NPDC016845 TaxID=3364972 RepID=UPI003789CC52
MAQLQEAVVAHADVDQAKGVICLAGRIPPAEAWDVLREVSMRTNTKLRDVALQIITWAHTGRLEAHLRRELQRQCLVRHAPPVPAKAPRARPEGQGKQAPRQGPGEPTSSSLPNPPADCPPKAG